MNANEEMLVDNAYLDAGYPDAAPDTSFEYRV